MSTIQEQLKQERFMVARGVAKQENSFRSAEEGGRVADTSYGKALTRQFLPALVDYVKDYCSESGATRFGKYRALIRQIDADKASLLALRGVFQDPFAERPLPTLAKLIGTMIEDEIKFTRFHSEHGDYYDAIISDFKQKNTTNYRHRPPRPNFQDERERGRMGSMDTRRETARWYDHVGLLVESI